MTSAVVDCGSLVFEFASNGMENHQQDAEEGPGYPAVIVEPVPSARFDQGYAAQILVYDDETYLMQDVAEEQEIETDSAETVCRLYIPIELYCVLFPAPYLTRGNSIEEQTDQFPLPNLSPVSRSVRKSQTLSKCVQVGSLRLNDEMLADPKENECPQ